MGHGTCHLNFKQKAHDHSRNWFHFGFTVIRPPLLSLAANRSPKIPKQSAFMTSSFNISIDPNDVSRGVEVKGFIGYRAICLMDNGSTDL